MGLFKVDTIETQTSEGTLLLTGGGPPLYDIIEISGSLETTQKCILSGSVTSSDISLGFPLTNTVITSSSDIKFTGGTRSNVVQISTGGVRLGHYTNSQTSLITNPGTIYFNTSTNQFRGFNGTNHVILG